MTTLRDIVDPWLRDEDSDELIRLRDQLDWLRRHLFEDYEPEEYRRFDERLTDWLLNVDGEADRKALFRLLGHLFFLAKPQFKALCRGAFNDAIVRWLIEEENIQLDAPDLHQQLEQAVAATWFGAVTDSMNLNSFIKANRLSGHDIRAEWRTLERLGDPEAVRRHVTECGVRRLVLLEDFVGSGEQMRSAVVWARDVLPDIPILVAPLICCPEGAVNGQLIATRYGLAFEPTLRLRDDLFLLPMPVANEPPVFAEVRSLILRIKDRLGKWSSEPFGHEETGAIFAMFTNCPDNTLPIIHEQSASWNALFPRVRRE
jgi:hypothetical protein